MDHPQNSSRHRPKTILLVDDEEMIIEPIGLLLEELGYHVISAGCGEHAIDIIEKNKNQIDLIILDMLMPGMNGHETFHRIRAVKPHVPVLLASGYSYDGQIEKMTQDGCNGFIQKPYRITQLQPKIEEILSASTTR